MDSQRSSRSVKRSWDTTIGHHHFNYDNGCTHWVNKELSNQSKDRDKDYVLFKINCGNILKNVMIERHNIRIDFLK